MSDLDLEALFPTHGAISEAQQIGRSDTIEALADRIRGHGDALLLHPRKEGKTSVAEAALGRVSREGGVVASVDSTAAGVHDGPSLARAILTSVRDQDGHVSRLVRARAAAAERRGLLARFRRTASAAEQIGIAEAGSLIPVLALMSMESPSLDDVLSELAALGEGQTVGLFLDEVQEVAGWKGTDDVQRSLARFMRRPGRKVSVVAAGSDRSAAEALFADGGPLHWEFEAFALPPIDRVDWHAGLHERFAATGIGIDASRIDQVLEASGGHPLRTMSVAKHALRETRATGEQEVTWGSVDAAIAQAQRHPSWST